MKKKINIQFLIITLLAILTTVSLSIFVFYELFKQEVMADLKTNTQLLVETDAWEQIVEKKDAGALDDGVKQLRLTLVDGTGEVILVQCRSRQYGQSQCKTGDFTGTADRRRAGNPPVQHNR